jgi:hypothetical protein
MGNGALPHGPSYRAHPRLYQSCPLMRRHLDADEPVSIGLFLTQSSGKARYVTFFRDTAVKLPVKRIIVGPADGADERSRALSRRLQ